MGTKCPEETAKDNRRANLKEIYGSKEWKRESLKFLGIRELPVHGIIRGEGLQCGEVGYLIAEVSYWYRFKKPCEWCGTRDRTLPHHPYLESYKDGTYTNFFASGCMVLCGTCHYSLHRGLVLCKRCGKRYHGVGADICRTCWLESHPEVVEARKKQKEDTKALRKKIREDGLPRYCHANKEEKLEKECQVTLPSIRNCKDCIHLGKVVKKRNPQPTKPRKPQGQK